MAEKNFTVNIYPQDPGTLAPVPVELPASGILPGPIGPRVAVYEYNRDSDKVYPAARPGRDGQFPTYPTHDHRFHQLNAYAIVARAVALVEMELGRDLRWGFDASRLIVLPHAGYMANAWYDKETHSLQFYSYQPQGRRKLYHTCLSHDIVAHETGHAVLDAIRGRYTEPTHPQTSGLHEAIGDLTAVFASLSHKSVRRRVLADGLENENLVSEIAEDFDPDGGIRQLFGGPDPYYRTAIEPHDLSVWLTRALYDSLCQFFKLGRSLGDTRDEALRIGRRVLQRMVVRALDYLPPADATFADVARAISASDSFVNPDDDRGYRKCLIKELKRHRVITQAGLNEEGHGTGQIWKHLPRSWPRITQQEAYEFLDRNRPLLALSTLPSYRDFVVRDLYLTTHPKHRDFDQIVMTYEYPVDVEIEYEDETYWHPVWGGGTLVFSRQGRAIHHAEKPVTKERVEEFLAFVGSNVAEARIARISPGPDSLIMQEYGKRPWSLRVRDGEALLRTNPAARCHVGAKH